MKKFKIISFNIKNVRKLSYVDKLSFKQMYYPTSGQDIGTFLDVMDMFKQVDNFLYLNLYFKDFDIKQKLTYGQICHYAQCSFGCCYRVYQTRLHNRG